MISMLLLLGCQVNQGIFRLHVIGEAGLSDEFADGWTVELNDAYSYINTIQLNDIVTDEVTFQTNGSWLVNWLEDGEPLIEQIVPQARWDFSFQHAEPNDTATLLGNIDEDIRLSMIENDMGMWLGGTAQKGEEKLEFQLGLKLPIRYTDCTDGGDGLQGLNLLSDSNDIELTWHLRHAFFSSLRYGEEELSFQALAEADQNGDGVITATELGAVNASDVGYNVDEQALSTMEQFIATSLAQGFRINGLGLCTLWVI